jgi:hypothetical protein
MSEDDKLYADLWVKQSDLFLKLVALVPVVELGITASCYTLMNASHPKTAQWVAVVGVLVMGAAFIILRRTTDYIGHFRNKITHLLPVVTESQLTGRKVGLFLPGLCIIINLVLATGYVKFLPP